VREFHVARLLDSLNSRGFEPHVIEIPDEEKSKTLDTVQMIYNELLDAELDRHSIIFALGGGAIGDIAGFAAATYMRGISFVQMPTTLLAMVDASIGGKVAVDHPGGKNLIGAFKQPYAVIADTDTLTTLPAAETRSGMAEVVKHGIIGDPWLFEMLERDPTGPSYSTPEGRRWIARAMQVKIDIVARDPFDLGERGKLNLGHTFGHAIERLSGSELLHGEAVAIGLVCAARLAVRQQLCAPEIAARIEELLSALGLPTRIPGTVTPDAILSAMTRDKKRVARQMRFVLPLALGRVEIVDHVPIENVAAILEETRA
jgi:3-dehydroquinate synthase